MTLKLFKIAGFLKGKLLHIFLCLVLLFAFCFKDSVPSAEALGADEYSDMTDVEVPAEADEAETAATVYTQAAPLASEVKHSERLPLSGELETKEAEAESETEAVAETKTEAKETESEEALETTAAPEETAAEKITEAEETDAEELSVVTAAEEASVPSSASLPLNERYGQRYQEQWEADFADRLFDLANNERVKHGLAPFKKMDELTAAAVERAWEVSRSVSHTRPDGTSCFTVLPQYGLPLSARAENIAYYSRTPQEAFNSLMGNPAHRDPMLSARFEYMGVGFYCVYDDTAGYHYYWTQIFYTP